MYSELLLLLFLFVLSATVSGSEVAVFSLGKKELEYIKEENLLLHNRLQWLMKNKRRLLSSLLISNNLANLGLVALLAGLFPAWNFTEHKAFGIHLSVTTQQLLVDLVLITFLILLIGEIVPKILAKTHPINFLSYSSGILIFIVKLTQPINWAMVGMVDKLEKLFFGERKLSIDELNEALEMAQKDKNTTEEEQKIFEGIINFGNTECRQIMTPRVDTFAISTEESFELLVKKVQEKRFSRIPIFENNIDNIVGVLYARDLLPHLNAPNFDWKTLVRPSYFVPETKKLDDLLHDFQTKKIHLAIVVDEYGGTSGIVTLDDVIEEIIGDLSDEFDDEDEEFFMKISDYEYIFEGKTSILDCCKVLDLDPEFFEDYTDADSLAGILLENSDGIPQKNFTLEIKGVRLIVASTDRRRIRKVRVVLPVDVKENN